MTELPKGWVEITLEDLCTKIGSGSTPRGGNEVYKSEGISLIRSQNILDFSYKGLAFIDDKQAEKLNNVEIISNDILINITGDSVARVCKVPDKVLPARVNQHVAILRIISEKLNPDYLKYYLLNPRFKKHLLALANSGGTRNALTKVHLQSLEIIHPEDGTEGDAITNILTSFDEKIELLQEQNKTLENIAKTLFKEWFVDGADESWEEINLLDIFELVGGGTPKTSVDSYWNGNIPWLAGGDISSNHKSFVTGTVKRITEDGLNNSSAKLLPKNATIISARGTVGKYCLVSQPMTFSQSNYGIIPQENIDGAYFFVFLLVDFIVNRLQSAAYGSVFDTITTSTFKSIDVLCPNPTEILKFNESVSPIFKKILANKEHIEKLGKTRDILLPKLLNGSIRIEGFGE